MRPALLRAASITACDPAAIEAPARSGGSARLQAPHHDVFLQGSTVARPRGLAANHESRRLVCASRRVIVLHDRQGQLMTTPTCSPLGTRLAKEPSASMTSSLWRHPHGRRPQPLPDSHRQAARARSPATGLHHRRGRRSAATPPSPTARPIASTTLTAAQRHGHTSSRSRRGLTQARRAEADVRPQPPIPGHDGPATRQENSTPPGSVCRSARLCVSPTAVSSSDFRNPRTTGRHAGRAAPLAGLLPRRGQHPKQKPRRETRLGDDAEVTLSNASAPATV